MIKGIIACIILTVAGLGLAYAACGPISTAVDVTTFGADKTGAADSTTAINNAMAAANGTGGFPNNCKDLYFPGGQYAISGTLTHLKGGMSGCGWFGDGPNASVLEFAVTSGFALANVEGSPTNDGTLARFFIRDMAFLGPGQGTTANWLNNVGGNVGGVPGNGGNGEWTFQNIHWQGWNIVYTPAGTAGADTVTWIKPMVDTTNTFADLLSSQSAPNGILDASICTQKDTFIFDHSTAGGSGSSAWSIVGGYLCLTATTGTNSIFHYLSTWGGGNTNQNLSLVGIHFELQDTADQLLTDDSPGATFQVQCLNCNNDNFPTAGTNVITLRSGGVLDWESGTFGGHITLDTDSGASLTGAEPPPRFNLANAEWDNNGASFANSLANQTCTTLVSCSTISSGVSMPITHLRNVHWIPGTGGTTGMLTDQ